ncbi:protein ALP1-like [Colias croceus]|uniref:protein ALP1-like n=1 Tax=Colias crocea TaxID=72248 RepID=UPI001E280F7E|nr:protein ALP1-like [Colias croceus]
MSTETFDYICNGIRSDCTRYTRISVEQRLVLTLRYLITGTPFRKLAVPFRISKTAIANIVVQVCNAIWNNFNNTHMKFPNTEDFKDIANSFSNLDKFPHCCGNLDGKHIRLNRPHLSGSMYYNYKHFYSIVLLAVSDSQNTFRIIDVGAYGKDSDGGVLSNSIFFKDLSSGKIQLPSEERLPESNIIAPYVFLGDEAFPLKAFLMRPYPRRQASGNANKSRFNYKLSTTRVGIECTFGMAASKFRILLKSIETSEENAITIVKAICILHNIIIHMDGKQSEITVTNRQLNNRLMRIQSNTSNNRATRTAINAREKFTAYFYNQQ